MNTIVNRPQSFHVPTSFEEFCSRYPTFVRDFVRRRMRDRPPHEKHDRESELVVFLLTLPAKSKFRRPGTNGYPTGCMDRIMTFNPAVCRGDMAACFFGYLNVILRNQFFNLEAKKRSDPLCRPRVLQIREGGSRSRPESPGEIGEDRLSALCRQCPSLPNWNPANNVTASRFFDFVRMHNRELVKVLVSIASCPNYAEAQASLGMNDRFFARARRRLKVLYRCFMRGEAVPKQRRIYQPRQTLKIRTGNFPEAA